MKYKIITLIFTISICLFATPVAFAAESPIENLIIDEVTNYVNDGTLDDFHLNYIDNEGYQTYYYKKVHLGDGLEYFSSQTQAEISQVASWYDSERDETWDYIFKNLDADPEYLEPNKYLGIYWDSRFMDYEELSYLYLIWTSPYSPSEFSTILSIKESGTTYNLYDSPEDAADLNGNWEMSDDYHYKEKDLTIHITPISRLDHGKSRGIPLKQHYKFEGFTYGLDDAQYGREIDPTNLFSGIVTETQEYDLGHEPKYDGKSAMQLVNHGYEIIEDCEVQFHYSLNMGGYIHYAMFNTTIDIDKIYRVDTAYKVTNDNVNWFQGLFMRDEEHQITKSLTDDTNKSGFLNLTTYQGFTEGNYASTKDNSKHYRYRLHLNYDENNWNIFDGPEYEEADFKRVSDFQILRMNYLVEDQLYDVPIKMDLIEGNTKFFFDPDTILDTNTKYFDIKDTIDDFTLDVVDKLKEYKDVLLIIGGVLGTVVVVSLLVKLKNGLNFLFKKDTKKGEK